MEFTPATSRFRDEGAFSPPSPPSPAFFHAMGGRAFASLFLLFLFDATRAVALFFLFNVTRGVALRMHLFSTRSYVPFLSF